MPENISKNQKVQEEQYSYPYHYIPRVQNGNFRQSLNFSWGFEYLAYTQFLLDELKKIAPSSVLDVGCGDGRFLHEVKLSQNISHLFGIDYSEKAIQFAKILNPDVEWVAGDICSQTVLSHTFMCLTLIETLEHIPPVDTSAFLKGLHFYLKKEGYLLLTVPSDNLAVTAKHYRHFSEQVLRDTLKEYFVIEKIVFLNRINSVYFNLIKRVLTNPLFICNAQFFLNHTYNYYMKNCLIANAQNAGRLFAICRPIVK